jgi:hypothetical protein
VAFELAFIDMKFDRRAQKAAQVVAQSAGVIWIALFAAMFVVGK